ncbi:MAG: extracellular solute-binding protein [Betaproteobacteria bacterium]|jgi:iron(III) transport system substrate-binding protein|nr:extracellular solute-binding protein [Rhodocyclaceae bacterium]MCA3133085.1 extracellular solute-binding protein [Rhodocyclaceae bacterium]MCA3141836.1 extracellular solute-binding protein [Rhodocyclaceae bacterium]MCA3144744.1 extracellular solute-binding protein [Rhodocyclaceae bacterium]MCE2896676.1 extracellular solute-binding protein [Betaproteobacteria bacterium]
MKRFFAALAVMLPLVTPAAAQQDKVLNLYSARHYDTDEALYANFTKATGIRVNRIEAGDEALLERLRNEGANSPADVLLIVDASRLHAADLAGLFAPVKSALLDARIPAALRSPGGTWFAFSSRARILVADPAVPVADIQDYLDLADGKNRGRVCTRPGSHPYMLSLIASVIAHHGEARAEAWARATVANMARPPRGGDTDQIRAVAAGECAVALTNSYYLVRLMRSRKPEDRAVAEKVRVIWPDQAGHGTHMNVSGGGVLRNAPNREAAVRFLEYLAGDEAQAYFANGNNEWPVVRTAIAKNPELESLGRFKSDTLSIQEIAVRTPAAQRIADRAGWR